VGTVRVVKRAFVAPLVLALAGCGGGSGGTASAGGTAASAIPAVSPTTAAGVVVAGNVVALPDDAYGPTVIAGVTYASADAAQTTPLAGAVIVVGPVPITGATPPADLPPGDVTVVTNAAGAFAVTMTAAPAAPSPIEPFVLPQNNVLGFVPPKSGYYVQVFAPGTLPLHRFTAASSALVLRVSSASAAEVAALAAVNADRAANGAGPLIFDESAEEAARLHAADATARGALICHYDANNVGPASRYLAAGGIGLTGENVGITIAGDASAAFAQIETGFLSEKIAVPPGGHFTNLVDGSHIWAGLAASGPSTLPFDFNVDYELVTPSANSSAVAASGYTIAGCPPGIVNNKS